MAKKRISTGLVGDTGAQIQGGISLDEPLGELAFPGGLEVYRKMYRNDPVIGGLVQNLRSVFRGLQWEVKKADGSKEAERVAEELKGDIRGLRYGLVRIVEELTSAIVYGFAVGELLWEVEGFRVYWRDIEPRHQLTIQSIDEDAGYVEQLTFKGQYRIPLSKCVIFSINSEGRNPFGVSLLRWLYKPYYYKTRIEAAEGVSIDRDLGGLPVMKSPEGFDFTAADSGSPNYDPLVEKTLRWAVSLVTKVRKDKQMGVVIPHGWDFSLVRSEGTSSFDTDKIIRRYNTEMCTGLLEGFIAAGGFSSTNQANVKEMINVYLASCDGIAADLAEVLNRQVIRKWCAYNNYDEDIVRLQARPTKQKDLSALASFVGRLVKNGVITPNSVLEEALLEVADLPSTEQVGEPGSEFSSQEEQDNQGGQGNA